MYLGHSFNFKLGILPTCSKSLRSRSSVSYSGRSLADSDQLLCLEIPKENCRHSLVLCRRSSGGLVCRHGVLHEDCFIPRWRCLLPLLAYSESVSKVSVSGFAHEVGYMGHSYER